MNNSREQFKKAKDYLKQTENVTNVARNVQYWRKHLLGDCSNLILYKDMPENIKPFEYVKNKIIKGYAVVFKKNDKLHCIFECNAFGYDENMIPNRVVYANPILGSGTLTDGKDCVICWNSAVDTMTPGESDLFRCICRYARMLADLESTFANAMVYARSGLLSQANNSTTAQAFNEIIEKLRTGDVTTVANTTMNFDSLKPFDFNINVDFTNYCETRDYILNCFYNEIGLQTLEEKKERMVTDEIDSDADLLKNNIDKMYAQECENWDKVNELFGTHVVPCKNKILEVR